MFKVNDKDINKTPYDLALVSLLLTLHTFNISFFFVFEKSICLFPSRFFKLTLNVRQAEVTGLLLSYYILLSFCFFSSSTDYHYQSKQKVNIDDSPLSADNKIHIAKRVALQEHMGINMSPNDRNGFSNSQYLNKIQSNQNPELGEPTSNLLGNYKKLTNDIKTQASSKNNNIHVGMFDLRRETNMKSAHLDNQLHVINKELSIQEGESYDIDAQNTENNKNSLIGQRFKNITIVMNKQSTSALYKSNPNKVNEKISYDIVTMTPESKRENEFTTNSKNTQNDAAKVLRTLNKSQSSNRINLIKFSVQTETKSLNHFSAVNQQQITYNTYTPNITASLSLKSMTTDFNHIMSSTSVPDIVTKTKYLDSVPTTSIKEATMESLFQNSSEKQCKPVKNVIFLKTHKTGSSTIINIMQRFAHRNNLTVALPAQNHFLGWPNTFQESYVFEHTKDKTYNIICNHARFHRERMLKVMQSNETKIVTVIRDPLYQFESTAVYLNFASLFKLNRKVNIIDAFFNKSTEEIYNRTLYPNTANIYLTKNPIAYDMGFRTWRDDDSSIITSLEKAKKNFDLVMISDYMAESLVLLKDLLCWDLKDVVYFTMNKRPDKYRQKIENVEDARQRINEWNKIDKEIFNHFNKTFWEKVNSKGEIFRKDLHQLLSVNKQLDQSCLSHGRHYDKSQPWFPILGFKLKNETRNENVRTLCEDMIRSEIDFTNLLKLKQTERNWKIPTPPPKTKKAVTQPASLKPIKSAKLKNS